MPADGACDGEPIYEAVAARSPEIAVVIPPRATSVESAELRSNATRVASRWDITMPSPLDNATSHQRRAFAACSVK